MKIAMFANTSAPLVGGIERSVATFRADLRALGHDVLLVTLRQEGNETEEEGLLRLPALPETALGQETCKQETWNSRGAAGLTEALDRFAPDLVHAHQPFLLGDTARCYARRRGLPLVLTHHTLYGRAADRVFLRRIEALERAAGRLAVAYSNDCEAVVAPTGSVAALLMEQGVLGEIGIVPTGIDTGRFSSGRGERFRATHAIPADGFVVGHLGRLIPAKRVAYLAEAVAEFMADSIHARALFCGEGEAAGEIRARFEAAGLAKRLTLVGNLPDDEVSDAYAAMDVFAFASLTDTQGIVLLEAMAAGTPVLALRATGPQDLVVDGVCGRLLDPGSAPRDFAKALAEFARDPSRFELAGAAQRHAASYDRRRCADALVGIYREVLQRGRRDEADRADRADRAAHSALEELQRRVEAEWRILAERGGAMRALLPTRGFPGGAD